MKKIYTLSLLLACTLSFGQLTEDFSGTGFLTANGWANHNGLTNQLSITSGSLSYAGISNSGNKVSFVAANTEDVHKLLPTAITTVAYYSAIVNMPNTTNLIATATGEYSISFGSGPSTATSAGSLNGRIYFKAGAAPNTFNIGILNGSGGTAAPTFVATDFAINTPLFLVVKYVLASNTASLFVNPSVGAVEPAGSVTNNTGTTAAPTQIANIALRQAGSTVNTTGNVEFDAIRVADNWAYVTGATLSIKQNSISGLRVYPNPAKNNLFISSDNNEVKQVEVYNVLGKVVLNTKVTNAPVNISAITAGVYVVKITEAGKTATRKLVIE